MAHNQFGLLKQRRFLPFFVTQCFGAFNDNVFRQAIIGLLFWMEATPDQRTLYLTTVDGYLLAARTQIPGLPVGPLRWLQGAT